MKYLKQYWLFVSACYWFIYVCGCFLKWEIYNPFWWVLKLPYDIELRAIVFMVIFVVTIFGLVGYGMHKDKLKIKENEQRDKI